MTSGFDEVDDPFQTPTRRHASPRRLIFIATLRAGASWLFFRVALSTRMIKIWAFVRALKNSQLTTGKVHVISGSGQEELRLVSQTLLMPVFLHALSAFVLGNFCFSSFFQGTHISIVQRW
jgi:hypothetical protein